MKWLLFLSSVISPFFLTQKGSTPNFIEEFKTMVTQNVMKTIMVYFASTALAIMFAAGATIIALDIGAQLDQTGTLFLSSIIISGSVLCALSALIIWSVIYSVKSERKSRPNQIPSVTSPHPVQDAIAVLILDFVKEREHNRMIRDNPFSALEDHNKISSYSSNAQRH